MRGANCFGVREVFVERRLLGQVNSDYQLFSEIKRNCNHRLEWDCSDHQSGI